MNLRAEGPWEGSVGLVCRSPRTGMGRRTPRGFCQDVSKGALAVRTSEEFPKLFSSPEAALMSKQALSVPKKARKLTSPMSHEVLSPPSNFCKFPTGVSSVHPVLLLLGLSSTLIRAQSSVFLPVSRQMGPR